MSWNLVGNIKGPPGDATIPDPLDVDTIINLGTHSRLVALADGLRIEVKDTGGTWHTEVEWTEA